MGGKTATTTQQVQIPPEVMARYNRANEAAETAASQPFKAYSQDPNAFVAPMTQTQQTAMQNVNRISGMAQPYTDAAAGLMMSGAQGVGPLTQQQIQSYQNPYTQSVVDATMAGLQQQQGQALSRQQGEAIRAGAFGGDRAGLQRAQLVGQQGLATAQAISPLYQRAYEQAVQTAVGQQGVQAGDYQRMIAAGQQLGGLGTAAQRAALDAAQAQFNMGTGEQQTAQAGKTALYNQFLQERGYPFQTAQFLANIAMGTGALSGSTTTTAQPIPVVSDARDKTNIQPLGKGLYAYDYKDDVRRAEEEGRPMPPKRVGPMAQDIEERAPGLVGEVNGHKVIKGLSPESMGGAVVDLAPGEYRENFAQGGMPDFAANLRQLYAAFGAPGGGGEGLTGGPYGARITPLSGGQLKTAGNIPSLPKSMTEQATAAAREFGITPSSAYEGAQKGFAKLKELNREGPPTTPPPAPSSQGTAQASASLPPVEYNEEDVFRPGQAYGGLVGYAGGGGVDKDDPMGAYGAQGAGIGIPTEQPDVKPLEAARPPTTQPKSMLSDITDAAKTAASIYAMSDERMKSGMQQVGELYNGLPVYKYRMGDGPSQLGLSAQEARGLHPEAVMKGDDGLLRLNYDRATRAYGGGLVPREGYQAGGMPDDEYAIRTIAAEASGRSPEEARAIARVLENRRASGRWGDTYRDVVTARNQFEPWNDPAGRNYPANIPSSDPRLSMARAAYESRLEGEDPTGGALHFWAPGAQKALGRAAPSWDTDDATMIGSTRFVRGVDGRRPAGLTAYAGQPEQSAATRAIDTAAGTPSGLGRAAAAPQAREAESRFVPPVQFTSRSLDKPAGERFKNFTDFLTSKQFIIPALEGLGALGASPSLTLGPALLQGLGAGARAYRQLEKGEQDLRSEEAAEQQARVRTDLLSRRETPYGNLVITADGSTYTLPQYNQMVEDYKAGRRKEPPPRRIGEMRMDDKGNRRFVPETGKEGEDVIPGAPGSAAPGAPAAPPATTAPTTQARQGDLSPRPEPEEGEAIAPGVRFTNAMLEAAKKENPSLVGGKQSDTAITLSRSILDRAEKEAQAARDARTSGNQLAVLFGKGAQLTGAETTGAGFEARARIANVLNTIARALGKEEEFTAPNIAQQAQKITALMEAARASKFSNSGIEMLQSLARAVPNMNMDKNAYAGLGAEILVENKKNLDRNAVLSRYAGVSGNVVQQASSLFDKEHNPAFYDRQKRAMKHLILNAPDDLDQMFNGRVPKEEIIKTLKRVFPKYSARDIEALSGYFEGG